MYQLLGIRLPPLLDTIQLQIPLNGIVGLRLDASTGSALLRLLNGLDRPDTGEVRLDGQSLSAMDGWSLRRRAVMCPRTPMLMGTTLRENLLAGLQLWGVFCDESDEVAMMDRVSLQHAREGVAAMLSNPEQQRLCLARVLMMKPAILLLEDPLPGQPESLWPLVREWVTAYGGSVICTGSDENALRQICDEVLLLPLLPARERHHTAYH